MYYLFVLTTRGLRRWVVDRHMIRDAINQGFVTTRSVTDLIKNRAQRLTNFDLCRAI